MQGAEVEAQLESECQTELEDISSEPTQQNNLLILTKILIKQILCGKEVAAAAAAADPTATGTEPKLLARSATSSFCVVGSRHEQLDWARAWAWCLQFTFCTISCAQNSRKVAPDNVKMKQQQNNKAKGCVHRLSYRFCFCSSFCSCSSSCSSFCCFSNAVGNVQKFS